MVIKIAQSALLEIDVQNDFSPAYTSASGKIHPEGALAVKGGDRVIPALNRAASKIAEAGGVVAATQDWHPAGHVSFASAHPGKKVYDTVSLALEAGPGKGRRREDARDIPAPEAVVQALWPDHCVAGSPGAELHDELKREPLHFIIRKGFSPGLDSYSAFFENDRRTPTGLEGLLKGLRIGTVFLGGLATDYCVLYSALDAARLGFQTILLDDAVEGVGVPAGSVERAFDMMRDAGVLFMNTKDIG